MAAAGNTLVTATSLISSGRRPAHDAALPIRALTCSRFCRSPKSAPLPQISCQEVNSQHSAKPEGSTQNIAMELFRCPLPAVAHEVSDRQKSQHPDEGPAVSEPGENRILQRGGARHHCREMA